MVYKCHDLTLLCVLNPYFLDCSFILILCLIFFLTFGLIRVAEISRGNSKGSVYICLINYYILVSCWIRYF